MSRSFATTVKGSQSLGSVAEPTRAALHVLFPPILRRRVLLGRSDVVLGRDPGPGGCALDDNTVSRRHATICWDQARATHTLTDNGSRNGSSLDGVNVGDRPCAMISGSLLRLGDTLLVYEQDSADDADDPASPTRDAVPGVAAKIGQLRAQMARAARDPAPVLIIGATGTGKERIAQDIHRLSGRAGRLVALNCAALSPQLVESQLFGHIKGAFTGATETQLGLFRAANGGTLFLDEIGELAPELQPKLLRALQEREVLPVGSTQPVKIDVRVIAATHRDLADASATGEFRQDLYARLSLWELRVPTLRERRVDLLDWTDRLQKQWAEQRGAPWLPLQFDVEAAEALLRAPWQLNLRGLDRLVHELATSTRPGATIGRAQLPPWIGRLPTGAAEPVPEAAITPPEGRAEIPSRAEFTAAFEELGGSVHALAKRFGRDRRQIYRWMESFDLKERRAELPKKSR
jgi:DNA-binding NtrC family response regulator